MKEVRKSSCKMCHGGCGVLVHLEDGEVVKVEGDRESPLNRGRLCVKGRASLEHLNHPDRLKYPMKRAGERGGGKWERISWDEALDTIASRLGHIREEYGPESIALGQGTGRRHFNYVIRLANALGTPNWCEPGCAQCFIPRLNTSVITFGEYFVCDYYGEVNPACILAWGHNPLVSGPDGELQFPLRDCLKKGSRLIVVDPRRSETAERAELWLQLRPGTDDALALAMLNVIITEGLYDRDFVDNWTSGLRRSWPSGSSPHPRLGGGDHLGPGGKDTRGRAPLRHIEARHPGVGGGGRAHPQLLPDLPGPGHAPRLHRQHRRPRRLGLRHAPPRLLPLPGGKPLR